MRKDIKDTSLSIILPAYNDELTIGNVVDSLLMYIKPAVKDIEIIIVEDGSPGKTPVVCDDLSRRYSEVKVIHHKENMGYGVTLRDGFAFAKGELIFYTDGDNQYDMKDLLTALNIFGEKGIDAIIGYRKKRADGIIRFLISRVYNILVKIIFFINVKDVNCSFKLFKNAVLRTLKLNSRTGFIDAEMVYELKKKRYSFKEIAVTNFPNKFRRSNFVNPQLTLRMLQEMFKKRFYY